MAAPLSHERSAEVARPRQLPPAIAGTATVGQPLSATTGTWSGTPISYAYQWQRCSASCASIASATGSSYTLTAADLGARVQVVVAAGNAAGAAYAISAKTSAVAPSAAEIKASRHELKRPARRRRSPRSQSRGYTISFAALTAGP